MKNLYKCTTKNYSQFYVVANSYSSAAEYLKKILDKNDYGYTDDRIIIKVELIAIENKSADRQYFFDSSIGHLVISE